MKNIVGGLMALTLAIPALAAPPTGFWESANGDFAAGSWTEVRTGGAADAVGNEWQLAGDNYQLTGALVTETVVAEKGFDFVRSVTTCAGGVLTLSNTEADPWVNPADPNITFTVTLGSVEVTTWTFTDPMGNPTGEIELAIRAEGSAADDPAVEAVFEAGFTGTPGLDMTVEPAFQFGALDWADLTVTKPVVPVLVDIKPGSDANPVNLTSRGVIPVAIMGSADFDVTQIDPTTIRLEGLAPVRWSMGDLGLEEAGDGMETGDGYADLKLKFKTAQLAAVLGDLIRNERVELTLTAELLDGTQVEGSDSIRVLKSNRKTLQQKKEKKNGKK